MEPEFVSVVIGAVAAGVAVTTLLIVIYQTGLMRRQTTIMNAQIDLAKEQTALAKEQTKLSQRQLEIVEKQDELLARRAVLRFHVAEIQRDPDGSVVLQARVENVGRRAARDYFWQLLLPVSLPIATAWEADPSGNAVPQADEATVDGIKHRLYRGRVPGPTYPTRMNAIVNIKVPPLKMRVVDPIRWLLVTDDGVFPEDGKPGIIALDARPG
jgi:hypothetical protein